VLPCRASSRHLKRDPNLGITNHTAPQSTAPPHHQPGTTHQVRVSQAALLERHSFQVITPVISRMVSPTVAAATELTPSDAPPIHSATVTANAKAVIFSSRDMGPSLSSSLRAAAGASGVSLVSVGGRGGGALGVDGGGWYL